MNSRLAVVLWGGMVVSMACRSSSPSSSPDTAVVASNDAPAPAEVEAPLAEAEAEGTAEDPQVPVDEPVVDDGPLAPPTAEVRDALAAIRTDPPPKHLVRDTHYWISNEQSHFLWHDAVSGVGGAFVGVATDQNYMLAAWARSELLILMDFDAGVVDLHRVYGVLFGRATSPAELLELWSESRREQVERWLRSDLPPEQVEPALAAYGSARSLVEQRLRAVLEQYRARGLATFLSDAEQFEHLQTLWRNGRVVAVRGDLTADQTMVDIAAALRTAGMELGVLYLSNAEQYFRYQPSFRRNVTELPMAANGVVLRTHGWIQFGYVKDEDYHYNTQPAVSFAEWMARGRAWGVPAMLEQRSKTGTRGYSTLGGPPSRRGGRKPRSSPKG